MRAYIVKRLLQMIPVVILVTMMVYSLILLMPGDPITAMIGRGEVLDKEQIEILRHKLGLDKSIPVQYAMWLSRAVRGDFGRSTLTNRRVIDEIKARLPVTLEVGFFAMLFSALIAIPVGIISSVRRGSKLDIASTVLTISGVAMPEFFLGIILILVFGVTLGWLPTNGFVSVFKDPIEGFRHLCLPIFSLSLVIAATNMRQTRSAMLEVLVQDYVRTARAKGLAERIVIWIHALRNALLPVVTLMGLQIGRIFGGAVIIETLFAIPGMGRLIVGSILLRDFPVVQASILIVICTVLLANLLTDLLYAYLDPRIRYG